MATFGTFVAGQVLTAAELNTGGAWQGYTPTFTQSVAITKTTDFARFTQLGKWVQGSLKLTASSAGTANNKILVGLPVAASANNHILGMCYWKDASNPLPFRFRETLFAIYESSTTMGFSFMNSEPNVANTLADVRLGEQVGGFGFAVASGDIIYVQFSYEAA
jgi:hypothetical protein